MKPLRRSRRDRLTIQADGFFVRRFARSRFGRVSSLNLFMIPIPSSGEEASGPLSHYIITLIRRLSGVLW